MKKTVLYILIAVFIIVLVLYVNISNKIVKQRKIDNFNYQFEMYQNRNLSGTEIATIINKAIDNNEKNKVQKNEKGIYLDNGENTIKIELKMISGIKEDNIEYSTFPMEAVNAVGIASFLSNYNTARFKCANIEYHKKTGQVSKIVIEQQDK